MPDLKPSLPSAGRAFSCRTGPLRYSGSGSGGRGQTGAAGAPPRTPEKAGKTGKAMRGEIISPAPPCFFQLLVNARGNAGEVRSPRRRPQVAGIHFRRKTRRASCKFRVRTACPGQTGIGVTRAGENVIIPPAPPWFALRLRRAAERADAGSRALKRRVDRGKVRKGRKSRRALFGPQPQCRRARLRPPAAGRPMFRCAQHRCGWKGFPDGGGARAGSTLWKTFVCEGQPSFNDMAGLRLQRTAVSRSPDRLLFAAKQATLNALGPRAAFERPGRWS